MPLLFNKVYSSPDYFLIYKLKGYESVDLKKKHPTTMIHVLFLDYFWYFDLNVSKIISEYRNVCSRNWIIFFTVPIQKEISLKFNYYCSCHYWYIKANT